MRRRTLAVLGIIAAVSLVSLAGTSFAEDEESGWMTSYKEALDKAKAEKKPILADFTGSDWCGWCIKLKNEVFATDEFKKWATENVVLLEIDFPRRKPQNEELKKQNQELQRKFGIRGYPTIIFIDAEEKVLGKSGYLPGGPKNWIEDAGKKIKEAKG